MKNKILYLSGILLMCGLSIANGQPDEPTGLPGDQFSLEGALELFKKASSPEDFEKMLNTEDNHVNNLDLDGDGDIDYIKVIDNMDGDVHALVLQVTVSSSENQDIAVIEIEKDGDESALLQIIGDEEIYGESIIIEPSNEGDDHKKKSKNKGPYLNAFDDIVVINVWGWPSIRYVYAPVYRPWISPWRWSLYPTWWRPWRPLAWSVYHPFRARYRVGYVVAPLHRVVRAHRVYTPVRVSSVTVKTRHSTSINNYRVNRTKTTVIAKRGDKQIKAQKTKTSVSGRNGNTKVKATKTKTAVSRKKDK